MNSNSKSPPFNDVADFVRAWARIPVKRQIDPQTHFERDLGVTGDDGSELLEAAQKKFGVDLAPDESGYRKIFGLGPNEYLFNAEGFVPHKEYGKGSKSAFWITYRLHPLSFSEPSGEFRIKLMQ